MKQMRTKINLDVEIYFELELLRVMNMNKIN